MWLRRGLIGVGFGLRLVCLRGVTSGRVSSRETLWLRRTVRIARFGLLRGLRNFRRSFVVSWIRRMLNGFL